MVFLPAWIGFEVVMILLVIGLATWGYFRWDRRYRGSGGVEGFQATDEKFTDPTTGRMVHVFFNPATGERQYRDA